MNPAILNSQFVQVALPLMVTFAIAAWLNNRGIDGVGRRIDDVGKRIDDVGNRIEDLKRDSNGRIDDLRRDVNGRIDEVIKRLDRIENLLADHDQRIVRLEERTSPLARR